MGAFRLQRPMVILSLVLLILNDHVLKGSVYSGLVTGKLSDFAGLFFFPFFVITTLGMRNQRLFDGICLLTGICFTLLKISPDFLLLFEGIYEQIGMKAAVVQDPTDLIALTVLPLASYYEAMISATPSPKDEICLTNAN